MSYDDFGGSSSFTSGAADRSAAEQVSNFQASQTSSGAGNNDSGSSGGNRISASGVVYDATGNVRNPYPNSFFSRVFGADNVSYQNIMPQATLNRLGGMYDQRYNNPNMAVSRGFGKLFGGAEGEMTSAGPRVAGVRPQTLQEGIAGLAMGSIFPGAGMLEKAGRTLYAPEGMLPEGYEQEKGGFLESFLGGFGGLLQPEPSTVGREFDRLKGSAASLVDQAREGIRSLVPDAQADQMVDSVARPMESRADIRSRTGGRASTIPSPADEARTMPNYGPSGPVGYGIGERPRVDLQRTSQAAPERADVSALLAGMDRAKAAPSAPSGIGNPTATADIFNLRDPGVLEGLGQAGVPQYKLDDLESLLGRSGQGTIDTDTGRVQVSYPGTSRGYSLDYGSDLGLFGSQLEDIFGSIGSGLSGVGITQNRVTGSGNFQEGPAFLQGIGPK